MAEATFNRELGAAPAGISRFGQIRTDDGDNVTVNSYRTFAGDGSYPLADVFEITYGATGTATLGLNGDAFAVRGIRVIASDGTLAGEIESVKTSRRLASVTTFSVTSGDTASIYVDRTGRSESEYRVTIAVA
jgi:hypothetical protein